jgi:Glyoxalase-like domain
MQTSFIRSVTFDCADALVVARFWAAALGGEVDEGSTPEKAFVEAPDDEEASS